MEKRQEVNTPQFLFYNPKTDGKPTMNDYIAELDACIFSPLFIVHEMFLLLDEAGDFDEDKQRHVMNLLWVTLTRWQELTERFKQANK